MKYNKRVTVFRLRLKDKKLVLPKEDSYRRTTKYGDLVYKLKNIVGSNNFSAQFIKIIVHYK